MNDAHYNTVALLTDFGVRDHYVAVLKAVLLSQNPSVTLIDLSHDVEPGNIQQGAYLLWSSYTYFPSGTIFLCVVDPEVGTERKLVCLHIKDHLFLAPDNGLLEWVRYEHPHAKGYAIDVQKCRSILPKSISSTFHGRDILAPVTAALTKGYWISELCTSIVLQQPMKPYSTAPNDPCVIQVIHIDRFGNIITNVRIDTYDHGRESIKALRVGAHRITEWTRTYAEGSDDAPFLLVGSSGLVEVAMKKRNAASVLNVSTQTPIEIEWR